jgi:hypothetical protein
MTLSVLTAGTKAKPMEGKPKAGRKENQGQPEGKAKPTEGNQNGLVPKKSNSYKRLDENQNKRSRLTFPARHHPAGAMPIMVDHTTGF